MEDVKTLIRMIQNMIRSKDLTNTESHRKLADDYRQCCREFNDCAEKCRLMLSRNQRVEALQLAQSMNPPMETMLKLLNFPERDTFLLMYTLYHWEMPPDLYSVVAAEVSGSSLGPKEVFSLLNAYRKIAREEGMLKEKILLMRRIVKLDNTPERKAILRKLEEQWIDQLAAEAKEAIQGRNYTRLQELQTCLNDPGWLVAPNQNVRNKVDRVLNDYRLTWLGQSADKLLARINEAYSAFDYVQLEHALNEWDALLSGEEYDPGEVRRNQAEEARKYYLEQKGIRVKEQTAESLVDELQRGLANEAELPELEKIVARLTMMEYPIPEHVMNLFMSYKNSEEAIQKRRLLLRLAVILVSVLAVLGLAVLAVSHVMMNRAESQWKAQIETALEKEKSSAAFRLLNDLKQKSPSLYRRAVFTELASQAKAKQDEENRKQEQFRTLLRQTREGMKTLVQNPVELESRMTRLSTLASDAAELKIVEELKESGKSAREQYIMEQNSRYRKLLAEIFSCRKQFFILLDQAQYAKAEKQLAEIDRRKQQLLGLRDVEPQLQLQSRGLRVEELRAMLDREREKANLLVSLNESLRNPESVEQLQQTVADYRKYFSGMKMTGILDRCMSRTLENLPKNLMVFSGKSSPGLYNAAVKKFQQLMATWQKAPIYALIIRQKNGTLCDLYSAGGTDLEKNNKLGPEDYELHLICFKNIRGQSERAKVFVRSSGMGEDEIQAGGKSYKGQIIWPASDRGALEVKEEAPYGILIKKISHGLQDIRQSQESTEENLLKNLEEVLAHTALTPSHKNMLAEELLTLLSNGDPQNAFYPDLKARIGEISSSFPKEYNFIEAFDKYPAEQRKASQELLKLANEVRFQQVVQKTAAARNIQPVGYLRSANGQFTLVRFRSSPEVAGKQELWTLPQSGERPCLAGTVSDGQLTVNPDAKAALQVFQLVCTPQDGRSTAVLTAEVEKLAEQYSIKKIIWPTIWPELKGGKK